MFRPLVKLSFAVACVALPASVHASECTVVFGFEGDDRVSGAVVEVSYANSGVSFVGNGEDVLCHASAPGVLARFNDGRGELTAALLRVEPFGGSRLFACTVTGEDVEAADFHVETIDASDSNSNEVSPLPTSVVTEVDCEDDGGADDDTLFCRAVFTLDSAQKVSGLVYETSYGSAGLDPVGSGDDVECNTLVANGLGTYNDDSASLSLIGALIHVAGVEGIVNIASCRFVAPNGLAPDDLEVTVTDAVGPSGDTLAKTPSVFLGEVECGTASELPPGGDDGGDDGGAGGEEECVGPYEVTFAVTGSERLGALQIAIDYAGADGSFVGSGDAVQCAAVVNGLAMFNDRQGERILNAGLISTGGFQAPTDVVTCIFESPTGPPQSADFAIEVQDASHVDGSDVTPVPGVHLSAVAGADGIECGGTGPECGNGVVEGDEECDDGNDNEGDGCLPNCAAAECGDIDGNGALTATDAKRALNTAIGLGDDCSLVRCDVNTTGTVTATDARMILNASIGLDVPLDCSWAVGVH